jgi:hypothetical protein
VSYDWLKPKIAKIITNYSQSSATEDGVKLCAEAVIQRASRRHHRLCRKKTRQLQGYNDDGIDDDDIGSGGDIDDDDIGNGSFKNGDNISGKSADDLGGKDGVCQRGQGRHQAARTTAAAAIQ